MSRSRLFPAALVATLAAAGCADEPATAVATADLEEAAHLVLLFPELTSESAPPTEVREVEPTTGPARAFSDDPDEPSIDEDAVGEILSARTDVGFTATYAFSMGRHSYTGNVGAVSTQATVSFDGQVLGTSPASQQNHTPYLFDWGAVKSIWAEAYVFIDQNCGLRVDGQSEHRAWWEWFMAGPVPKWGEAKATTQAFPPAEQLSCEEVPVDDRGGFGGGTGESGSEGSDSVTCWYWVTYDPQTGEVYDWSFLFCEGPEEGG